MRPNDSTSKVLLLGGTLLAALGLSACQNTPPPPKPDQAMRHMPDAAASPDRPHKMRHMDNRIQARWDKLSPEQKAKFEQRRNPADLAANAREDRRKNKHQDERKIQWQQVQQACQGQPAGQVIQVKMNDRVINGRCELRFVKDRTSS